MNKQSLFLFIDTANKPNQIGLLSLDGNFKSIQNLEISGRQSEMLLSEIDGMLKYANLNIKKLGGILVVNGPGSYTSLRVGVSLANALSFASNLGIARISAHDSKNKHKRALALGNLNKDPISALYLSEPNITTKKIDKKTAIM